MPQSPSSAFWTLIERWQVAPAEALELVGFWGKIGVSGKRPPFKLNTKQQHILAYLVEIDAALGNAGVDTNWLHRRAKGKPFANRSPLTYMKEEGQNAMADLLRTLTGKALKASLSAGTPRVQSAPRAKSPPAKPRP